MKPRVTAYEVLTFDCYGTMIDWETGIWDALQPLLMAGGCAGVTRSDGLALYAKHEPAAEAAMPVRRYPEVLAAIHRTLAADLRVTSSAALDAAFGDSVAHWPAFPDSADALRELQRHYRLVVLSNVHRDGFAASNRKLGVEFDAVYTAEDVGAYKPSSANFEYLLAHLDADFGLQPGDVLHTAQSLHHDHVPARRHGLANAWIDRQRLSERGAWGATAEVAERPRTDFLFFSLAEMVAAVRAEGR